MNLEDMILVSIDDHMIEPPNMYENHVPRNLLDDAPKVLHEDGIDRWVFQGEKTSTSFGMSATVGWPSAEWGFNPDAYTELRPGCFDVHERVRDMNANDVDTARMPREEWKKRNEEAGSGVFQWSRPPGRQAVSAAKALSAPRPSRPPGLQARPRWRSI